VNFDKLFSATTKERIVKHYIRECERQHKYIYPCLCQKYGRKIETGIAICDLKNGGTVLITPRCYQFVKLASDISQNYYPETLEAYFIKVFINIRLYIVNCSWVLKAGWAVIKGFLDKKTRDKVKILGDKYLPELLKRINEEDLPEFLGGKCKCEPKGCLMQPAGPWKEYYDKFSKDTDENDFNMPEPPPKYKPQVGNKDDNNKEIPKTEISKTAEIKIEDHKPEEQNLAQIKPEDQKAIENKPDQQKLTETRPEDKKISESINEAPKSADLKNEGLKTESNIKTEDKKLNENQENMPNVAALTLEVKKDPTNN